MDTASIIGLLVWFCCILYSSIRYFTSGYIRGQFCSSRVRHIPELFFNLIEAVLGDPDMFLGLPDPDPLVRGTDPAPDPDPSLFS
jgi:hypothetical protein